MHNRDGKSLNLLSKEKQTDETFMLSKEKKDFVVRKGDDNVDHLASILRTSV